MFWKRKNMWKKMAMCGVNHKTETMIVSYKNDIYEICKNCYKIIKKLDNVIEACDRLVELKELQKESLTNEVKDIKNLKKELIIKKDNKDSRVELIKKIEVHNG